MPVVGQPRASVSRPTFPDVIDRLRSHFRVIEVARAARFDPSAAGRPSDAQASGPHIASAMTGTRHAMAATAVANVLAAFGHGPLVGQPSKLLNVAVLAAAGTAFPSCPLSPHEEPTR